MLVKVNGERTIYSIFHILNGKKSFQTIQDSHLYSISKWFDTSKNMNRRDFETIVTKLHNQGFIHFITDKKHVIVKTEGQKVLNETFSKMDIPKYIDGISLQRQARIFWKRLSLFVQVISNINHQTSIYIPIQRDSTIQHFVKQYLMSFSNRLTIGECLHRELLTLLQHLPESQRHIFVWKLSGFHRAGWTNQQISKKLTMDEWHIHYLFLNTLHYIIQEIKNAPTQFPILFNLCNDLFTEHLTHITESSQVTYRMLEKGYGVDEIAATRGLKTNTVEDHIVELALSIRDFDISPYVSQIVFQEILTISNRLKTKQLKVIKQELDHLVSYFQIRLVLAKSGGGL
ncbi:helix-turn-helix domain-containing protein [Peribacillus alkalitolerans]|uniref:helix-turn-helix domain-containing protein n=1 Tax=Peribacillus alkalitolerans TaxID=1550385 RepID=UPI001F07F87F|nr:helix-turn-helix domain-containing protein [Peribacillus alkalitolerans]